MQISFPFLVKKTYTKNMSKLQHFEHSIPSTTYPPITTSSPLLIEKHTLRICTNYKCFEHHIFSTSRMKIV